MTFSVRARVTRATITAASIFFMSALRALAFGPPIVIFSDE